MDMMNLQHKKILLMGKAGVGKTSIRSIIFANVTPRETLKLEATNEVSEIRIKFMGLILNILDFGGQINYIKNNLSQFREHTYSGVEIFIFVIDAKPEESDYPAIEYYKECVDALEEYSQNAKIYVLIHKMDLISSHERDSVFQRRVDAVKSRSKGFAVKCFPTSIFETSLYKAWNLIIADLSTESLEMRASIKCLAECLEAEEVILFEKSTFLCIWNYSNRLISDDERYESISCIIKKFKLSCLNSRSKFNSIEIRNRNSIILIEEFTKTTFVMITINLRNSQYNRELMKLNLELTKKKVEGADE